MGVLQECDKQLNRGVDVVSVGQLHRRMHVPRRRADRSHQGTAPCPLNGGCIGAAADVALAGDVVLLAQVEQEPEQASRCQADYCNGTC